MKTTSSTWSVQIDNFVIVGVLDGVNDLEIRQVPHNNAPTGGPGDQILTIQTSDHAGNRSLQTDQRGF